MRWRGGVLKPPDQERKKLLQRSASLEIRRYASRSAVRFVLHSVSVNPQNPTRTIASEPPR